VPEDTRELLEPYGEWAGLASVYLLAHVAQATAGRTAPRHVLPRGSSARPGAPPEP